MFQKCIFFASRFSKRYFCNIELFTMSQICQITGKKSMVGNHVSHSKRRVKRKFNVNIFRKNYYIPEDDRWISLKVSAAGMRTINKKGIKAALADAKSAGYIDKI